MKIIKLFIPLLFLLSFSPSSAQDDHESKYKFGKDLLAQKKYSAAMEILKPLTVEEDKNPYVQYAHYFYAYAAFKGGYLQDAYIMLLRLMERFPDWEKLDDAYYLMGNVAFEQKKYRAALKYLEGRKKDLREDIDHMKAYYLDKINPVDTLINIQRDFPSDPVIAKTLAKKIMYSTSEKHKMLLEYLLQEYKLDREKYIIQRKSVMKPAYNVAVVFPFTLKDFNTAASTRPNQFVYDMYEGVRMAVDSLKRRGIKINLFAYDSEKDDEKVKEVLNMPELKSMDLIIGPVYPALYPLVNEFGLRNRILVVNPLSQNHTLTEQNSFVYLFQSTLQTYAGQAARYASKNFKLLQTLPTVEMKDTLKQVIIFQSPNAKDSLVASSYRDSITTYGFEVKFHEVVNKDNIKRVSEILKDSVMLMKVSHVFVSSTDQVLAANIISSMEISGFKIPIVTSSDWLQFSLLTYDQFERREVHFLYPEFVDFNASPITTFRKAFFSRTNSLPTTFSIQGFEMMLLFGKALGKHGNYFVQGLQSESFIPGVVLQGFAYPDRSNAYIPLVKFRESQLVNLNNPLRPYVEPKKKGK